MIYLGIDIAKLNHFYNMSFCSEITFSGGVTKNQLIVSYLFLFWLYCISTGAPQEMQLYSITSSVALVLYFHILPHSHRRIAWVSLSGSSDFSPHVHQNSVVGSFAQNPLIFPHLSHLISRTPLCPLICGLGGYSFFLHTLSFFRIASSVAITS